MVEDFKEHKRAEFGLRAAKTKWFKWLPGMRTLVREGDGWVVGPRLVEDAKGKLAPPPSGAIPDVEDPATRGCIRQLTGRDGGTEIFALALEGLL